MGVLLPILGWSLFILLTEWILWSLFRRRFTQICYSTGDSTMFHFFTLWRLRFLILLHTILLLICVVVGLILLWP